MTPKYGFKWLTPSERRNFDKESIIQAIENFLVKKPLVETKILSKDNTGDKDDSLEPKQKKMKLFNFMNVYSDLCSTNENDTSTILRQFEDYLLLVNKPGHIDTKEFWLQYQKSWPELTAYTKHLLSVPATSAPVERIFSVGGAILRPARRRLSDKNFEMLMFLKCNLHLFKNT